MLYSHNIENEKLTLFTLFLNKASEGESKYADVVNNVILETHLYAKGEKNLYNINRDSINIILLLVNLENDYFKNLSNTPENYNQDTYSRVLDLLKANKPSLAF